MGYDRPGGLGGRPTRRWRPRHMRLVPGASCEKPFYISVCLHSDVRPGWSREATPTNEHAEWEAVMCPRGLPDLWTWSLCSGGVSTHGPRGKDRREGDMVADSQGRGCDDPGGQKEDGKFEAREIPGEKEAYEGCHPQPSLARKCVGPWHLVRLRWAEHKARQDRRWRRWRASRAPAQFP